MRGKSIFISMFFILAAALVQAQDGIFGICDKQVYITGEKIRVSGKLFGNTQDEVVQVLLLDREGHTRAVERSRTSANIFFTDLQLKGELKSDNYMVCLRVGNRLTSFIPVMIINPVIPPSSTSFPQLNAPAREQSIHVTTSAQTYGKRETVQVKADSVHASAHYFITAYREDALSLYADSMFAGWAMHDIAVEPIPEGIAGRVVDADGKAVAGAMVTAAVLSDQSELSYGISNSNGQVFIPLSLHYADLPVAIQVRDGKGLRFTRAEQQEKFDVGNSLPPLALPARFAEDISARLIHTELANKLKDEGAERLMLDHVDTLDIYGKPDKRYILDNYVRFPDMREVIEEFIPEVRVRKVNGQTALQVVNTPYKMFFDLPAMVLLDGIPVTDMDQLLSMDPLKFRSIDVVARKFLLGDMQIPGIVHYKTYRTDMGGFKLPADVVLFDHKGLKIPSAPVFSVPQDQHMPYFRDLLCWQQNRGSLHARFPSSDAAGDFRIRVVAVDDLGKTWEGSAQITVK